MANETAAAQDAQFRLVSLAPDVCLTPGKQGVPVPYPLNFLFDIVSRFCHNG